MIDSVQSRKVYPPLYGAGHALDAIESWATNCYLLRETGSFFCGRLDGLLIPIRWDANPKYLSAVEVKTNRSDFLRGLKKGQYRRYAERVGCLYLATTIGVCKTAEVPSGIGHLIVGNRCGLGDVCVCRRRPGRCKVEIASADLWPVIFDLFDQFRMRRERERAEVETLKDRICERAAERMRRLIGGNGHA